MKEISLTKNKVALVDDDDFERVSVRKWSYHHTGYAVSGKPQISLHRFIFKAKKGQILDHINCNKLDNRKSNLRLCTTSQNLHRVTKGKGIEWRKSRKAWVVRMKVKGVKKYIGYFKDKKEAEEAHKQASVKYFKEFSPYETRVA